MKGLLLRQYMELEVADLPQPEIGPGDTTLSGSLERDLFQQRPGGCAHQLRPANPERIVPVRVELHTGRL